MHNRDRGGPRPGKDAPQWRTKQQIANAFAEALFWRDRLRAGLPAATPETCPNGKWRFAAAIARAELGRFHWDARREAEFRKLPKKPRRARGKDADRR